MTKISDQFRSSSCTITGRSPGGLPAITIDATISLVLNYGSLSRTFTFRVADFRIEYGIKTSMDTWTITGEDALANLGRANVDISWAAGTLAVDNAEDVCDLVGVGFTTGIVGLSSTATCNAQTITNGNALDIVNTLADTEGARILSSGANVQWLPRNWQAYVSTVYASDDGTGTNPVKYDVLEFTSMADNFADQVVVNIRAGNTVTAGTGPYSFSLDTYSVSDAEGEYVAQFELASLDVETAVPNRIGFTLTTQTNNGWIDWDIYKKAVIKFRTNTFRAFVLGVTYTGTLSDTRITYSLASSEFYEFLILDDAILGQLDYNKLGW